MSRRIRWSVPLVALVSVLALSTNALAAISFGAQQKISGAHGWNYGTSMEKSKCGSTTYLNAAYASDNGVAETGPYQGVYADRADITGNLSFTGAPAPTLVSPAGMHAERPALAAAGSNVYVVSVTQSSYDTYDPAAERDLYVATSSDCGNSFGTPALVPTGTTRVDYPIVAAAGKNVYLIWTDADASTNNIMFSRSKNNGTSWSSPAAIGSTSNNDVDGHWGYPSIAASGTGAAKDNLVAGWFTAANGRMVARTSTNSGGAWSPEVVLAASSYNDGTHYAIASGQDDGVKNRVAITYTTKTDVETRIYTGTGSLGAAKTLFTFGTSVGGNAIADSFGAVAEPFGANGFVAAFAGCYDQTGAAKPIPVKKSCTSGKAKSDLLLRESQNGTALGAVKQVAVSGGKQVVNSAASIVSTGSGAAQRRAIMFNGAKGGTYQVFARLASGSGP
jgi:hypothetical protein